MLYQRKRLADMSDIGAPAELPQELWGSLSDADLARIGEIVPPERRQEYAGQGFFPVADPEPAPSRIIGTRDFMRRLTGPELVAIETAAGTDATIRVYLRLLYAGPTVNLDAPEVAQALAYLVGKGCLTSDRPAVVSA
jgi:hypothetical protein